jgi:catechol 2,3-dioxygenase-like lactoylglutathione lyase family enzyme
MSSAAITQGAHHIGLTVPDIEKTGQFFTETLGFAQVGEVPDYPAVFLSDGTTMITLWRAADPEAAVSFDRRNVIGLHHLALTVKNKDSLEALHQALQSTDDVVIEFAPESLGGGPIQHMICAIPGGIRVEFIAPSA